MITPPLGLTAGKKIILIACLIVLVLFAQQYFYAHNTDPNDNNEIISLYSMQINIGYADQGSRLDYIIILDGEAAALLQVCSAKIQFDPLLEELRITQRDQTITYSEEENLLYIEGLAYFDAVTDLNEEIANMPRAILSAQCVFNDGETIEILKPVLKSS